MVKPMAFALFISCCVSAFCLAMLAYNLTTGELPFDIQPMLSEKAVAAAAAKAPPLREDQIGSRARINEETVRDFFNQMSRERENLAARQEELAHKQAVVEEIRTQALKMQVEIEDREKSLNNLLIRIEAEEREGLTRLAGLLAGMDMAQAQEILLGLTDNMATKVLFTMNPKNSAQMISELMKSPDKQQVDRVRRIAEQLYQTTDKK